MKQITRKQEAEIIAGLSVRAKKLFSRLKNEGRFYMPYGKRPIPQAMKELEDAGLVTTASRVNVVVLAYVPVRGFKPFAMEQWDL